MKKVPLLYILMVISVGASLGAIAALSKTSITNTLIETLVAITIGSAGFYYLNRSTLQDESMATRAIGTIGIVLVASVWLSFICVRLATFSEPETYAWNTEKSFEENVARAEIRAHAINLGMDPGVILEQIAVAENDVANASAASCLAGAANVRGRLKVYSTVYAELATCELSSSAVSSAAFYIQRSLNGFVNDAKYDDDQLRVMFSPVARSLLILADQFKEIADPLTCSNSQHEWTPLLAQRATEIAQRLKSCASTSTAGRLATLRDAASNYYDRWKAAAPRPAGETVFVMETLKR